MDGYIDLIFQQGFLDFPGEDASAGPGVGLEVLPTVPLGNHWNQFHRGSQGLKLFSDPDGLPLGQRTSPRTDPKGPSVTHTLFP